MADPTRKTPTWQRILSLLIVILGLGLAVGLIRDTSKGGLARLFCTLSILEPATSSADRAVTLAPRDPETHYTRALSLVNAGRLDEAVVELKQATALRPHHYYQWLDLAVTKDRMGDDAGAVQAMNESIRLAPYFAQPRWQLGNILYRQNRYDEAFVELRKGARSNPNLTQSILELAWVAADGDATATERFVQPSTAHEHLELARFFSKQNEATGAVRQAKAAGVPQDEEDSGIHRQIIANLIGALQFSDAYDIWAGSHKQGNTTGNANKVVNGDFIDPVQTDGGFGWQINPVSNVTVSLDPSAPKGGNSIRIEYNGESPSSSEIFRQLVLLEPNSKYLLQFLARADNLVTGGPPVATILDAAGNRTILAQSKPIAPETDGWRPYTLEYTTSSSSVVWLTFQRKACSSSPCPIFGKLWLSHFSINPVK